MLNISLGDPKGKIIKILMDSGGTESIVIYKNVKKLKLKSVPAKDWSTLGGHISTNLKVLVQFAMPELNDQRLVTWEFNVTKADMAYDMIIGQDLLSSLGIDLCFSNHEISWNGRSIPMKERNATPQTAYTITNSQAVDEATVRIKKF